MILTSLKDYTTLHNGVKMPWFGLGVLKVEDGSEVIDSVKAAIKMATAASILQQSIKMKKALGKRFVNPVFHVKNYLLPQKYGIAIKDMKQRFKHLKLH